EPGVLRAEGPVEVRRRGLGPLEPDSFGRRLVQRERRLSHRERVAEIGPAGVGFAVAESASFDPATLDRAMRDDPLRRASRLGERALFPGPRVQAREPADRPAVLARVHVLVDPRDAELASL